MVLRKDTKQFMIYQPDRVAAAFEALTAASYVQFGAWLQKEAARLPSALRDSVGNIGAIWSQIGEARQQINAGLAPNDVPDPLVYAQKNWDLFARWREDPNTVPYDQVVEAMEELQGAMVYLHERTKETGTNHPRWNAGLLTGTPCPSCGR